jgi:hypothetical protein
MAIINRSHQVPTGQPMLLGDTRVVSGAWARWFQDAADQLQRLVPSWATSGPKVIYANDAAAAAGGVVLGGLYFDGTIIRARLV